MKICMLGGYFLIIRKELAMSESTTLWLRDNAVIPCKIKGVAVVSPLTCYMMRWRNSHYRELKLNKFHNECDFFELTPHDGDVIVKVDNKKYKRYDFPLELKIRKIEYVKMQKLKHLLGRKYSAGGHPTIHIYNRWFNRSRRRFCTSLCGVTVGTTEQLKHFPDVFESPWWCQKCVQKYKMIDREED